jgi:glutamine amidotransferase
MHNGALRGFHQMKRDLLTAVEPSLFPDIEGSTDSEAFFFLALTFGLADEPLTAVAKAVGFIEEVGRTHGIDNPMQMTVATTEGESVWVFRYSTEHRSRSLFFSTDAAKVRELHPDMEILAQLGEEARFVVSEPLGDLEGAWHELPESHAGVIRPGADYLQEFHPMAP